MALLSRAASVSRASWILAALVVLGGCELARPADPLALDQGLIAVQAILFAGTDTPEVILYRPNASSQPVPAAEVQLTASTIPQWSVRLAPRPCTLPDPAGATCYGSALPETVKEGGSYSLRVTTPQDTIEGTTVIPTAPRLITTADTTFVTAGNLGRVPIPLDFVPSPDAASTQLRFSGARQLGGGGMLPASCVVYPRLMDPAITQEPPFTVEVAVYCQAFDATAPVALDVALLAYDSSYVRFMANAGERVLRQPWPGFGITRGLGLFASAAPSTGMHVRVVYWPGG